jgi:hypothetical protein
VDVVSLQELDSGAVALDDPDKYPWMLVPDCPCLSDTALSRLSQYVAAGGKLITTDRLGQYDEFGRPRLPDSRLPARLAVPDLGRVFAGDPVRDTHAGNTPPLFLWKTESAEAEATLAQARDLLCPVLNRTDSTRPFALVTAAADVQVTQRYRPGCAALSLVNGGTSEARDIRVRTHVDGSPLVVVYVDGKRTDCVCMPGDTGFEFVLPSFRSHCIAIVDLTEDTSDPKTPQD